MNNAPSSLFEEIAEVIGPEAARSLFEARGGGRISIPAHAPDGHWLVDLIGREAADALCAYYRHGTGGGNLRGVTLDLPRGPTGVMATVISPTLHAARRQMAEALAAGKSADEAARISGLTRRTGYRMLRRHRRDSRQGDLF